MEENAEFGSNPGNLGMYSCVPRGLAKSSALVVALHGGQQTARDFDFATGWSALGREHGFAVMFPEQKSANNSQNCFNWFVERLPRLTWRGAYRRCGGRKIRSPP